MKDFKKELMTKDRGFIRYLSYITQLGLNMVIPLLIFFFLSLWLDRKLQTNNIILVIGTILGIVSGFLINYRFLKPLFREMGEKEE
ncbi:MAG: AtpZ/AtpI family protein [Candidatus Cloacimonadia bacterium]